MFFSVSRSFNIYVLSLIFTFHGSVFQRMQDCSYLRSFVDIYVLCLCFFSVSRSCVTSYRGTTSSTSRISRRATSATRRRRWTSRSSGSATRSHSSRSSTSETPPPAYSMYARSSRETTTASSTLYGRAQERCVSMLISGEMLVGFQPYLNSEYFT